MREITLRNLTTRNHRRRDLWIQEVTDENGLHAEIDKRCVYHVKNPLHLANSGAVQKWVREHSDDRHCRLRSLTVVRKENTKTGEKHFYFKAIGSFYAVMGVQIFSVGFVQTYEVNLTETSKRKGEALL